MFSIDQLLPFMLASLALNLTPGLDMTFVVARTANLGRRAGISASLGIAAGSFVHSVLAAVGVSTLLLHYPSAFLAIKVLGAGYLCWLGLKGIFQWNSTPSIKVANPHQPSHDWPVFFEGLFTNLFNPKVALFMLAFLPQFVDQDLGNPIAQILFLGLVFNVGGTAVNCCVAFSFAAAARKALVSDKLKSWLNRGSAAVFFYLAARLAFSKQG